MAKKRVDIEALLSWAYRDELPKAAGEESIGCAPVVLGTGGDPVWRRGKEMAELGVIVDRCRLNRFGVIHDTAASSEPHVDAITVAACLVSYVNQPVVLPEGWDPLADMALSDADRADAIARGLERLRCSSIAGGALRVDPALLVMRHAITRTTPDWEADVPVKDVVRSANGRPAWFCKERRVVKVGADDSATIEVEVDGFCKRTQRPMRGAYQKFEWDNDPALAVEGRGLYEIWHALLGMLVEDLDGMMENHEAVMSPRPARPWQDGAPAASIIWPDLAPAPILAAKPAMRAAAPRRQAKAGPVRTIAVTDEMAALAS